MRSTDPIKVEKIPFSSHMEAPEQREIQEPEDTIYEPQDMENGYKFLYTDQIRRLDEEIKAFGYQAPDLKDQEEPSFFLFERERITDLLRRLRILSISGTAIYTTEDLDDIEELNEPVYASITEAILSSEIPVQAAALLTDKNADELKEALEKIPDELMLLVRDREWMAVFDQWNADFYMSPPATWFYEDTDLRECCQIVFLDALYELESWMAEETSPDSLITQVEFPNRNIGYHMTGTFNYEEQCIEMHSNTPLKGLTVKFDKDEEAKMGFVVDMLYPDVPGSIYERAVRS